jgi:hypothetical protein
MAEIGPQFKKMSNGARSISFSRKAYLALYFSVTQVDPDLDTGVDTLSCDRVV